MPTATVDRSSLETDQVLLESVDAAVDHRSDPSVALAAAVLGFFIVTFDAVVVNVALPSIRQDLGAGITGLQWVVDGYTLAFAAFLLSAGSLTDRIGANRAFGCGVGLFVAASVACGLAPSLPALVAFRLVQGASAAAVMPSSMALIGQAYPDPAKRARAVAMWAMGGAVACPTQSNGAGRRGDDATPRTRNSATAPTGTLMTKINRQLMEVSTPPSTGPDDDAIAPPIAHTAIACARARWSG